MIPGSACSPPPHHPPPSRWPLVALAEPLAHFGYCSGARALAQTDAAARLEIRTRRAVCVPSSLALGQERWWARTSPRAPRQGQAATPGQAGGESGCDSGEALFWKVWHGALGQVARQGERWGLRQWWTTIWEDVERFALLAEACRPAHRFCPPCVAACWSCLSAAGSTDQPLCTHSGAKVCVHAHACRRHCVSCRVSRSIGRSRTGGCSITDTSFYSLDGSTRSVCCKHFVGKDSQGRRRQPRHDQC